MTIDLLLTKEMRATMPNTIKEIFNFGHIQVIFPALKETDPPLMMVGDSAVIEGEQEEIVKWLKPFDGIAIGCGSPQLEKFTIMHIDENL